MGGALRNPLDLNTDICYNLYYMKKDRHDLKDRLMENMLKNTSETPKENGRRNVITIKVGAITAWLRDLLAVVVLWKILWFDWSAVFK